MTFDVAAQAYGRFMGRYSGPLAALFADAAGVGPPNGTSGVGPPNGTAGVSPPGRVLDVGCGPGALTGELVRRLGPDAVSAIDPSPPFVAAIRERFPSLDVHLGVAEALPFPDDCFEACLAQLVVHFMSDAVAGLAQMRRVTRPGGVVGACVWDFAGAGDPLATFWRAVRELDPQARDESRLAGARAGHLGELCAAAGLTAIEQSTLTVAVRFATFEQWWDPFTLGVGPAGDHVRGLDEAARDALRARCAELQPEAPFEISASAWCVRALA